MLKSLLNIITTFGLVFSSNIAFAIQSQSSIGEAVDLSATVTILGNELQYGVNGPHIPTSIDVSLADGTVASYFGGNAVTVGASETMHLGVMQATNVKFTAHAGYPTLSNPYRYHLDIASDDPNNVVVLANGDNYYQKIAEKGAHDPYSGQFSLLSILQSYINSSGEVVLASNQFLLLFELGTTNPSLAAWDLNDLVVLVTTNAAVETEIVMGDFINNTPQSSNGGFPFKSYQIPTGSNFATASAFTAPESISLKNLQVVVGKMTANSNWDWSQMQYHVLVWSSRQKVSDSMISGDLANVYFPALSEPPPQYGNTSLQPNIGVQPTFLLSFNLIDSNIIIPAGQTFYIGVEQMTPGGQVGLLGVMESNIAGTLQAIQCSPAINTPDHCRYPSSSSSSIFHNDQFAIKLTAKSL